MLVFGVMGALLCDELVYDSQAAQAASVSGLRGWSGY